MVHTSKFLGTSGAMKRLKSSLRLLLQKRFVVLKHDTRDRATKSFQALILEHFLPPKKQPRRRALLQEFCMFFNGHWKTPGVVHHICLSHLCCPSEQWSAAKAVELFSRALTTFRAQMFCKGNWLHWAMGLGFFALSAVHGLLCDSLKLAFHKQGAASIGEPEDVGDALERETEAGGFAVPVEGVLEEGPVLGDQPEGHDRAKSLFHMLQFMERDVWVQVFTLTVTLAPERSLMASLVHNGSAEWELVQLSRMLNTGSRRFRFTELHTGDDFNTFFRNALKQFLNPVLWSHHTQHEQFRSMLLQLTFRSCAIIHQTVIQKVKGFSIQTLPTAGA